jgi:hypothetical protein
MTIWIIALAAGIAALAYLKVRRNRKEKSARR